MKKLKKFFNNIYFTKNAPPVFEKVYGDINKSKSYKQYCKELHGVDFPCWNTLSKDQLSYLKESLDELELTSILDIGSGNGELTKYLAEKYNCSSLGIDFAQSPIEGKRSKFLKGIFQQENIRESFSVIISIDSFYMINSYKKYINSMINCLEKSGKVIVFFSLVDEEFDNSRLLKAIKSLDLKYKLKDFTCNDFKFWNDSLSLLDKYNQSFVDEGFFNLWNIKKKEADKNIQLHRSNNIKRLALILQRG